MVETLRGHNGCIDYYDIIEACLICSQNPRCPSTVTPTVAHTSYQLKGSPLSIPMAIGVGPSSREGRRLGRRRSGGRPPDRQVAAGGPGGRRHRRHPRERVRRAPEDVHFMLHAHVHDHEHVSHGPKHVQSESLCVRFGESLSNVL